VLVGERAAANFVQNENRIGQPIRSTAQMFTGLLVKVEIHLWVVTSLSNSVQFSQDMPVPGTNIFDSSLGRSIDQP